MRFILYLFILVVIPTSSFAATSSTLTQHRTDAQHGYTITYIQDGVPTIATDKGYASIYYLIEDGQNIEERYFDEFGVPITVSGYHMKRNIYDGDKLVRIEYYDTSEKLVKNKSGYAIVEYTFDEQGHIVIELYYDENGNPAQLSSGQYGLRRDAFDDCNRVTKYTYIGLDGNAVTLSTGYSYVVREYDDFGRSKVEMFFTINGIPAVLNLGHSGNLYIRDQNGKRIGTVFLDINGNPMNNNQGYGIVRYDYDEWNNIIKYSYFDLDGRPVALGRGQYGQVIEYERKERIRSYYVDANGDEIFLLDQYLETNPILVLVVVLILISLSCLLQHRERYILLLAYCFFILYMTLFVRQSGNRKTNFDFLWSYQQLFSNPSISWNVINNILLFIPLGALLYAINPRLLWLAPLFSISIEVVQYIGGFGVCEFDDMFGNTLGSMIGGCLSRGLSIIMRDLNRCLFCGKINDI